MSAPLGHQQLGSSRNEAAHRSPADWKLNLEGARRAPSWRGSSIKSSKTAIRSTQIITLVEVGGRSHCVDPKVESGSDCRFAARRLCPARNLCRSLHERLRSLRRWPACAAFNRSPVTPRYIDTPHFRPRPTIPGFSLSRSRSLPPAPWGRASIEPRGRADPDRSARRHDPLDGRHDGRCSRDTFRFEDKNLTTASMIEFATWPGWCARPEGREPSGRRVVAPCTLR